MSNPEEPECGWEQYFINSCFAGSLIQEIVNIIEFDDLEPLNFSTTWVDYDYDGDLSDIEIAEKTE